jgi:hypothetical protein
MKTSNGIFELQQDQIVDPGEQTVLRPFIPEKPQPDEVDQPENFALVPIRYSHLQLALQ